MKRIALGEYLRRSALLALTSLGAFSSAQAAQITSLTVTGGEFRMGVFTPLGPVAYTFTDPSYNLVADFPTTIGWDVNTTQTGAATGTVVAFPFGTPFVNAPIVRCDPQVVDDCINNPHTITTGTVNGGSATIADGDPIVVNINGLYANWNGIDFNQGGTTGDGVAYPGQSFEFAYTSTVSNVVGDTFDYSMTWESLIVGGPFNGQIGTWTFNGSGTVSLGVGNTPKTDPGLTLSANNFATIEISENDLVAAGYVLPPQNDIPCVGGCFDFIVSGLASAGDSANVVLPLSAPIPTGAAYAENQNGPPGAWSNFIVGTADQVGSAALSGGACPDAGDPAYTPGLTAGNLCVQLTIADGGPNDNDGSANTAITNTGGLASPEGTEGGGTTLTDISENGCTIASAPVGPGSRGDWSLIAVLLAWLGVLTWRRRRRLH